MRRQRKQSLRIFFRKFRLVTVEHDGLALAVGVLVEVEELDEPRPLLGREEHAHGVVRAQYCTART